MPGFQELREALVLPGLLLHGLLKRLRRLLITADLRREHIAELVQVHIALALHAV